MKIKPKGRKIYRRKDRFEYWKHLRQNLGSVIVTLLIAGGLAFVGYSAGAPVLKFLQERDFLAPPAPNYPVTAESSDTEPMTESSEESSEESEEPVSEKVTEPPTEPTTEAEIGFSQKAPSIRGYMLKPSDLMSESALQSALEELPEHLTHVIIPLKTDGGKVWYATSVRDAARANAVQAFLSLGNIYQTVKENGYEPVALVNTLEDTLFAKTYPDASYLMENTGELWTDKSAEEPALWLAPFSILTQDYLADLAEEIETAGFEILICDGLSYPNFPRMDLLELDEICSDENRYEELTALLKAMRTKAPEMAFFVRIHGDDALVGDLETVRAAEQLPADCLLITMNEDSWKEYEQLLDISKAVPAVAEWEGEKIPGAKIKSYVLNPENQEGE